MNSSKSVLFVLFGVVLLCSTILAHPIQENTLSAADIAALTNNTELADIISNGDFTVFNETTSSNGTDKQLYVIKAVVYEIGILTEVDDNSTESKESHERVDLTFFNAHKNGSLFDFGDIPVPIQANITGHTYTEILPFHIGDGIQNISQIASVLPLPDHVLDFTHQDDTLFQYHESPIHVHHHDGHYQEEDRDDEEVPVNSNGIESAEPVVEKFEIPHVSHEDLLKIPVIGNTIVIDANKLSSSTEEDISSSSSEEEESKEAKAILGDALPNIASAAA